MAGPWGAPVWTSQIWCTAAAVWVGAWLGVPVGGAAASLGPWGVRSFGARFLGGTFQVSRGRRRAGEQREKTGFFLFLVCGKGSFLVPLSLFEQMLRFSTAGLRREKYSTDSKFPTVRDETGPGIVIGFPFPILLSLSARWLKARAGAFLRRDTVLLQLNCTVR